MLPRNRVASRKDLRLDRSRHVHQIHRRPRGFAGAAAALAAGFFRVHPPNTFSAVFNISGASKSPTSSKSPFSGV